MPYMRRGPTPAIPIRSILARLGRSRYPPRQSGDLPKMRALATVHRWWGVVFCLLFAMWFASGIVMHFMPFPARDEKPLASGLDMSRASADQIDYDQWTLGGDFDLDRPLKHIALNDPAGTEVYLSSASDNVVLTT